MSKATEFGEQVEGYDIPVLNEREVRASAGIFFLFLFYAIMRVDFKADFTVLKFFIVIFLSDFIIRVFINPKYAPSLIIARLMVSRQRPEYVGAPQKKFAWKVGIGLASAMFLLLIVLNGHSIISAFSCLACLLFLFLESAFGICVGCLMYKWFYGAKAQYCPGEVCLPNERQEIQKTSSLQLGIAFAFLLYVVMTVVVLRESFSVNPGNLWEVLAGK